MRRVLAVQLLVAGSAVSLLLWPSSAMPRASGSASSGRCCFMVSVDSGGRYTDTYTGTKSPQWKGWAKGQWHYSARLTASYTGSGLKALGNNHIGLLSFTVSSSSYHVTIFQKGESKPSTCDQKAGDPSFFASLGYGIAFDESAKIVNGSRQLVIPPWGGRLFYFKCPAIVGDPGANASGLKNPDKLSVPAPSAASFRNDASFGKSCWQSVSADLKATVPNHYEGSLWVSVQFTYFPPEQLDAKSKALLKLENTKPKDSAAATEAKAGALDSQDPDKPDSGCA